jgi:hypothetical protein
VACRSPEEAIRRAERAIASSGLVAGAHVVRVLADGAAGDFGEPDYLAAFGTVPDPGQSHAEWAILGPLVMLRKQCRWRSESA